jgi:hypothetical protein
MNWNRRRILETLALALAMSHASASEMNMRVFQINDHLISFYDGRPAQAPRSPNAHNWADHGALDLVYDALPTAREARWLRNYLSKAGITRFTLSTVIGISTMSVATPSMPMSTGSRQTKPSNC